MGLWSWITSFVRQVAADDLEGTGSSKKKPVAHSPAPLYNEADTGAASTTAAAPTPQGRGSGEADDEAAAAWVTYNEQRGEDRGEGK